MRAFAHIATIAVLMGVCLGIPFAAFGDMSKVASIAQGRPDVVSSATVIQEEPSGHYTIIINRDLHTDAEVLGHWEMFLAGDDAPLIMEDVTCVALEGDAGGLELANQLASRLPANQMKVHIENSALALSKADNGIFDIIVMSDEMADATGASSVCDKPFADVIHR